MGCAVSRTPPPGPLPEAERGRKTFCSPSPLRGGGRGEGLPDIRESLSRQERGNNARFRHVDVGEAVLAALVRMAEALVVEAEGVEQRRVQVADTDDVLDRAIAKFIRRTVDVALLEA